MTDLNSIIIEGRITEKGPLIKEPNEREKLTIEITTQRDFYKFSANEVESTCEYIFVVGMRGSLARYVSENTEIGQRVHVVGHLEATKIKTVNNDETLFAFVAAEHVEIKPMKGNQP